MKLTLIIDLQYHFSSITEINFAIEHAALQAKHCIATNANLTKGEYSRQLTNGFFAEKITLEVKPIS